MSSLWIETTKDEIQLNSLNGDEKTEICIIGAGLFGLTTAYYLSKYGKKVIVIDKDKIGEKVSGNTTGKITSQHELFYNYLINDYGEGFARKYLEANEKAIINIQKIIKEEQIDCDFEIKSSYVFAQKEDEVLDIEKEVNAVNKIGKKAEFVNEIRNFPLKIKGAIKFENQAQYHPRKYMLGLCKSILTKNKIYENTTAIEVERSGNNYIIHTDKGDIETEKIVIATHYPILNMPGFYFTKMYQSTSYVIAIETNQKLPDGMFISAKEPIYSFRTAKYQGKDILLICGSDHKTGEAIATNEKYKELEDLAKKYYPDCKILFKWNTRDCISLDKIPYIGEFSNLMPNVYVATGYKKWGMTSSNIAANIITDKILGRENKYEEVFNSTRLKPIKNHEELGNILKEVSYSLVINKLKDIEEYVKDVKQGEGKIIEIDGQKVGAYRNEKGELFLIKPYCSHLGCMLSWNNLDKTWDCPCHGSRFSYEGKQIYDPAIKDLEKYN